MAQFKLKLDHDGIYWGAEEIAADAVKEGGVVLDHLPDNPPGRYRWDVEMKALIALPSSQVKSAPEAPSMEQAFHSIVESLEAAGHDLPVVVRTWRDEFKKSIDKLLG